MKVDVDCGFTKRSDSAYNPKMDENEKRLASIVGGRSVEISVPKNRKFNEQDAICQDHDGASKPDVEYEPERITKADIERVKRAGKITFKKQLSVEYTPSELSKLF